MSRLSPGQIRLLSILADHTVSQWLAEQSRTNKALHESSNIRTVQLRQAERNINP